MILLGCEVLICYLIKHCEYINDCAVTKLFVTVGSNLL